METVSILCFGRDMVYRIPSNSANYRKKIRIFLLKTNVVFYISVEILSLG